MGRKATSLDSSVARLPKLFSDHPEVYGNWSLARMANEIGVSRERVRQLLPDYAKERDIHGLVKDKLQAYVREHPEVLEPVTRTSGVSYTKICNAIGSSKAITARCWRELNLPNRKLKYTPEQAYEARLEQSRQSYRKRKDAHNALVRRWKAEHPEKTKEMSRRGQCRYKTKLSLKYCESPAICEEMRANGRIDLTCRHHQEYFEWHPEKVNHVLPAQD